MEQNTPSFSEERGDRRKKPTPFLSRYTFTGRRKGARRQEEQYNYYVDRLDNKTWTLIGIIMTLSIIDSVFTLHFLGKGLREINPVMNIAIIIGKPIFIFAKYTLTIIGILMLALHKNFRFVKGLIYFLIFLYTILNLYHIYLLFSK